MMNHCETMIALGGAVQPNGAAMRAFFEYAGGVEGNIVIIPTASMYKDGGRPYVEMFARLGLKRPANVLPVRRREDAELPEHVQAIQEATGIFMGGGIQVRLSTILGGTAVHRAMLEAYRRGVPVAGTSAGTAALSGIMISGGRGGSLPRQDMAQFAPGLGFTSRIIFDQHFRQRNRLGRLLYAVTMHPGMMGIGIDEDTAAIVEGNLLTVAGAGSVTIVDGAAHDGFSSGGGSAGQPVPFRGISLHNLIAGSTFNLIEHSAFTAEAPNGLTIE